MFGKREKDPSDAQVFFYVNSVDRSDCNTLERLCTFPTIHDQVLLQTRPQWGFPLVAPLPAGSNRAKNLQMLVPSWGFLLSTRPRQSPYVLWLHWKFLNSETWKTSLILGRSYSTKFPSLTRQPFRPEENLVLFWRRFWEKKVRSRELYTQKIFNLSNPSNDTLYI